MSPNLFGNRFYGDRFPAWHKLGFVSKIARSAQEALSILGSYWIEKRPVTVLLNGENQEVGDYALVRSPVPDDANERIFGYISSRYNILQPDDICTLFDESVHAPVETLGMLGDGEKLFLTWTLPEIYVNDDPVKTYGFVASGFDGLFGTSLSVVTQRVVCENTFVMAINESQSANKQDKKAGKGRIFTGKHISVNIGRDLGIWMEHVQEKALLKVNIAQAAFTRMDDTPVDNTADLANLLFKIYPDPKQLPDDYPIKLRGEKQAVIDDLSEKATKDRMLVEALFNGAGTSIKATGWGLLNAVTEYENYGRMTKKPAEASLIMGNRAQTMAYAYNVINNWMDQK